MAVKIPKPNYTQTPNIFIDEIMRNLSGSEMKVMMAIIRKTFGWQKKRDRISINQIAEITGLARSSISTALDSLEKMGYIKSIGTGKGIISSFEIVISEQKDDQKSDTLEKPTYPEIGYLDDRKSDTLQPKHDRKSDIQNKENKETIKEISSADAQSVFTYYFEKYSRHYNAKPVCNVGRFIKQIKTMLDSSSLDELKGMIDYIWKDDFVSQAGHSPETVFSGSSVSKFRARIKQDDGGMKMKTCEHCGELYLLNCRNTKCPGLLL